MKSVVWTVLVVVGLAWSAFAWLMHGLAGVGGPAVMTVTRWLEIDPASTQWLADGLAAAGGVAQWLVIAAWLLGLGVLGFIGLLSSRATDRAMEVGRRMEREQMMREGAVLEGEIRARTVDGQPRSPR